MRRCVCAHWLPGSIRLYRMQAGALSELSPHSLAVASLVALGRQAETCHAPAPPCGCAAGLVRGLL